MAGRELLQRGTAINEQFGLTSGRIYPTSGQLYLTGGHDSGGNFP